MSLFKIYGSSAGSGKTFTLTKAYLKLVLGESDPRYFQKILAITFTNDAANEMKQRIMRSLKEISIGDEKAKVLINVLKDELPDVEVTELRKRAGLVFLEILHEYNDFAVKTIDSFVNQIVSSFTFDLDLPYNYEINLDTSQLLSEAVDKLIDKIGYDSDLSSLLLDFAYHKIEEDKGWNMLVDEIKKFGMNIFENEGSYLIERNLDISLQEIKDIQSKIIAFQRNTLKNISELAKSGLDLIQNRGLSMADFHYGKSGVYNFYQKLAETPDDLFCSDVSYPKARHIDAFENEKWYGKNSPNSGIIDEIKVELKDIAYQILAFKSDKYNILIEIKKNLLKIPLLSMIKAELDLIKEERNEVFLSEFNKKILDIVVKEPVPFIYERIGEKYNHLLIDEFQDTSNMQFFNLLPLIDNAISKNKFNLIVGDPKQAIYRWRGGNIQLMLDLVNKNARGLKENRETSESQFFQIENVTSSSEIANLNVNYRSKKQIIEFNNLFFESLVNQKKAEYPLVEQVFSEYFQHNPLNPKLGGMVSLSFLEKGEVSVLDKILFQINVLLEEGYQAGDIAILCRKNTEGAIIADFLKKQGFEINSVDSLKISKNLEVGFLISVFRFVNQPENQFSRFEFIQFAIHLQKISNIEGKLNAICSLPLDEFLQVFANYDLDVYMLFESDYYTVAEYIVEKFGLFQNSKSIDFILTFLDILLQFFHKKSKNLSDFLEHWEMKKNKFSINNKSSTAITVTTVHKSKGLEYPIVILPYASWPYKPLKEVELWLDISELNYPELKSEQKILQAAPFKLSIKKHTTFAKEILDKQEELIFIENLNMLYVALTRPVKKLFIWCHYTNHQKGRSIDGVGEFFMDFLVNRSMFKEGNFEYQFGEKDILKKEQIVSDLKERFSLKFIPIFKEKYAFRLKTESNFRSINQTEKITLGNLVHAAFEKIEGSRDIEFAIEALKAEGLLTEELTVLLREKIKLIIENEQISFLFSEKALVKNETEILSKGEAVQRPDRVVFVDDKVYLIDYKTGGKSEKHVKQIRNYGRLLSKMGYLNIHLILIYFEPLDIIKISFLQHSTI
jgi:ATP-dependent exoDNAse (exonuclease V) beta subunit